MRRNPFDQLYKECNSGTGLEKLQWLADGPMIVDVEPSGVCNFRCLMCPTGLHALGRKQDFMDLETFEAILNKTDEYGTAIRFIGWGEPMMNPALVEMIDMASERTRLTHLNTNGSYLDEDSAADLIEAGLSSIKFSFQGIDRSSYHDMRRTDFFPDLIDRIRMFRSARDNLEHPWIAASTTTTDESDERISAFVKLMEPLVDQLSIGKTTFDFIDTASIPSKIRERFGRIAASENLVKRHPNPCPEVYNKLSIQWDGTVVVCCNSFGKQTNLGNIVTDDIEDIWSHKTIRDYRKRLAEGRYEGPLCSVCYDYLELTQG